MDSDRHLTTSDDEIGERLEMVRAAIAKSGRPDVSIVAVTKGFDASAVHAAKRLGLSQIGENYAQELIDKSADFGDDLTVNFIGRVQRNKVRKIHGIVDLWQSVARPEILSEIAKRSPGASVLIQIQPDRDDTRDGVRPPELPGMFQLAESLGVTIAGLMTIGVLGNSTATAACFREVDALADEYGVKTRSMGMSGDYLEALEAGSTMLRLGSVLFGPRPS